MPNGTMRMPSARPSIARAANPRGTKIAVAANAGYARVARVEEVVGATGFAPGAVAPFPAPRIATVLLERRLLRHEIVWAGAGSPRHMVGLSPVELARVTRAIAADLAEA